MNKALKNEIEKYREAAMLYWHVVGDNECAKDLRTKSIEDLQLQAVIVARVHMELETKDYKSFETWKKREDILENMEE